MEYDKSLCERGQHRDFMFRQARQREVISFDEPCTWPAPSAVETVAPSATTAGAAGIVPGTAIGDAKSATSPVVLVIPPADTTATATRTTSVPAVAASPAGFTAPASFSSSEASKLRQNIRLLYRLRYVKDIMIHPKIDDSDVSAISSMIVFISCEISTQVRCT